MLGVLKSRLAQSRVSRLVLTLLVIEFLDEWVFGLSEAAWPLIRDEFSLTYTQIGLLTTLPSFLAYFLESFIGILGDVWKRRTLILGGGILFGLCLLGIAASQSFWPLMLVMIVIHPSSGAFVGLSEATLMDSDPARHEQNMARWTFAGALGVLTGSITLAVTVALGWSWRVPFAMLAVVFFAVIVWGWRLNYPQSRVVDEDGEEVGLLDGFRLAFKAMRRPEVVRWLILLEFCNLLLDILLSFLALYLVDVVQVSESQAAFGVTIWTGIGLIGDFGLIFLLERVSGLTYLRWSVVIETCLYGLFLLTPSFEAKLLVLAALGFFNAGWYSILKGQLYSAMHGQSGAVMAVGTVTGILGSFLPLIIGALADTFGLSVAMWALMAGPVVIGLGLPRKASGFVERAVEE